MLQTNCIVDELYCRYTIKYRYTVEQVNKQIDQRTVRYCQIIAYTGRYWQKILMELIQL